MTQVPHFSIGSDDQHGIVAVPSPDLPPHLADWFLVRQQFESVPDEPGLYRLTEPERDGQRRALHAVMSLRSHGYTVSADPATSRAAHAQARPLSQRRSRLAHAAVSRSPQHGRAPSAPPPATQPVPPKPNYPPTVHLTAARSGRAR